MTQEAASTPQAGPVRGSRPGYGRASPVRLISVFVLVLGVVLVLGAVVVLAVAPAAKEPTCPNPAVPCGQPPVAPTLPPIAQASVPPVATPAPTIVRPAGSGTVPTAAPASTPAATTPTQSPTGSPAASVLQTASPSAAPATPAPTPPIANLPQPRPVSDAAPLRSGQLWSSTSFGFTLEYDGDIWQVQEDAPDRLVLAAAHGSVLLSVEGFDASGASPKALLQQKITALADLILGLTEVTDPARQLPGIPAVGHRQGVGALLNGTADTPQGPGANVDLVVMTATDSTISLRVSLLADDDLRDPAFAAADSIVNSIQWPGEVQ